jgi:prepilin-type N-terminal cleavage/methylation domain-containing protein
MRRRPANDRTLLTPPSGRGVGHKVFLPTTHYPRPTRRAFTLIELLVAITIFTILATLTIAAFRESDFDRASAASQQLRSMLEGARSRAIRDGQLRGIRLIRDPNNPQSAASLVYIGAPRLYEATATAVTYVGTYPNGNWRLTIPNATGQNLRNRGLLVEDDINSDGALGEDLNGNGTLDPGEDTNANLTLDALGEDPDGNGRLDDQGGRVEVPAYSGAWYSISNATNTQINLEGHYHLSRWDATANNFVAEPAANVSFRLELAPPILPGSSPQPLANQMAVDLVASRVPGAWRNNNGTANNLSDDTFNLVNLDILFTPRGDVTGRAATAGVIHFLVADVGDIALDSRFGTASSLHPLIQQPEKDERLVSLFTRTGFVTSGQVNRFGLYGGGAYDLVLAGVEAK